MNILQLCIRVPYPPEDGGSIAMYNLQKSLYDNGVRLKVLAFNTVKQYVDLEKLDKHYRDMTRIEGVYLDNRIKPFAALFNLFTGESYHIIRFIRRDFEELLVKTLKEEQFDIIQLESLYMMPYFETIRSHSQARIVLRSHNIEHRIWQRLAAIERQPLRKWYLKLLAQRLRHFEQWAIARVDAIAAMTPEDRKALKALGATAPIHIAPVGLDVSDYALSIKPDPQLVFHIGAMDWLPNQEGIRWFLEKVWPLVLEKFPGARFRFAGKKMPASFQNYKSSSVEVGDFVDDSKRYIAEGGIMVVPLFSGSGMRVKIVEGMALGKAIVTTSIGAEGIPAEHDRELIIVNNETDFAAALIRLLENPGLQNGMGNKAKDFCARYFDNLAIARELLHFYSSLK
jgi:glycosyltransferase involved in cell wall biosynthesis